MAGTKWLDRDLMQGPYLTLCVKKKQYRAAMRHLRIKNPPPMLKTQHSHATTHFAYNNQGELCAVVAVGNAKGRPRAQIHALLVHEAVHVWQAHRDRIGETHPASEEEAYAIQAIAQRLMVRYGELTKKEKRHAHKA